MDDQKSHKDLGQLLLEDHLISEAQLEQARNLQRQHEKPIGRVLAGMGLVSDETRVNVLRQKLNCEVVELGDMIVPSDILSRVSRSYAEKHRCVPILVEDNHLVVAMEDPTDIVVLDAIRSESSMPLHPVVASLDDIEGVLDQYPRLTQAQADALSRRRPVSRLWQVLHPILFLFLMFLPVLLIGFALWYGQNAVSSWALDGMRRKFDMIVKLTLGWALWSVILWEIDGLLFGQPDDKS